MSRKPRKLKPEERRALLWVQDLILLHIRNNAAARELSQGEALLGHFNTKIDALKTLASEVESVVDGIEPMTRLK